MSIFSFQWVAVLIWLLIPLYSMGLVLLVACVRDVRLDISRQELRRWFAILGWGHLSVGVVCLVLALAEGMLNLRPNGLPSFDGGVSMVVSLAFALLVGIVGMTLLSLRRVLGTHVPLHRQLAWESGLTSLEVLAGLLQLLHAGLWLILFFLFEMQLRRSRRIHLQGTLLATLAIAVRRGVPLDQQVLRLSEQFWGRSRARLLYLSENIASGLPLSVCLERQTGLLPHSVRMLVHLGEETGNVAAALEFANQNTGITEQRVGQIIQRQQSWAYIFLPLALLMYIWGWSGMYVIPKYRKILQDFGMPLPTSTELLFGASGGGDLLLWGVGLLSSLAILGLIALQFKDWEQDWPVLDRLFPRRNAGFLLSAFSLLVEERQPLLPAIRSLIVVHPKATVRRKLVLVERLTEQGQKLWDALKGARLLKPAETAWLNATAASHHLAWGLRFLGDRIEQTKWNRRYLWTEVIMTSLLVVLCIPVALFAVGHFYPMVAIILSNAEQAG